MVRIEQLQTALNLWHSQTRLAWALAGTEADSEGADVVNDVRLWRASVAACCWRLSQHQAAWSIVCEWLGIAPEFLDQFGDSIELQLTKDGLGNNTPTPDALREQFAEFGKTVGELTTAESIAAGWLEMFDGMAG